MSKINVTYKVFGYLFFIISIHGCQIDNYDEPSSLLKGHVVYEGKPIGVKATDGTVQLQLWQSGYGTETPIAVNVAQDGSYSIMLFDGEYRLVAKDGNGPWENRHDEIHFTLKGGAILDYPPLGHAPALRCGLSGLEAVHLNASHHMFWLKYSQLGGDLQAASPPGLFRHTPDVASQQHFLFPSLKTLPPQKEWFPFPK